jgi:hypothetical protein
MTDVQKDTGPVPQPKVSGQDTKADKANENVALEQVQKDAAEERANDGGYQ